MMETVRTAQDDMRAGYFSGGAGILASSIAWFAATYTAFHVSPSLAVWVLFGGGMLIHPVGLVLCKLLGASGAHAKGNPLVSLMAANTIWMIATLPLAYVAYLYRADFFFPTMMLIIGGRYLTFALLYGMRLYWALGATLGGAAWGVAVANLAPGHGALTGASIELVFAMTAIVLHLRWKAARTAS